MKKEQIQEQLALLAAILLDPQDHPKTEEIRQWAGTAILAYLDGKATSLDSVFGLRAPGRPTEKSKHQHIAEQIDDMRAEGMSWTAVADMLPDYNERHLRRIYQAFQSQLYVRRMVAKLTARLEGHDSEGGQKPI